MSLLNTSKAVITFKDDKRRYISVWNYIQGLVHAISTNVRVSAFIIDETVIQVGNQKYWL
ncbi:MAG TPA: hypothetical protein VIQ04_01960 [Nitrososphaeraceae archaeon]